MVPTIRWSRRKLKHWFSESTIKLIHRKKCLYHEYKSSGNPNIFRRYRSFSNLVRSATRQDTARHSDAVSQQCHSNPRQFWQWINSLKGYRCPIPPLHDSGIVFTKDSDKATLFNRYFCSVFTKEDCSNLHTLTPETSHPTIADTFNISPDDVYRELCRLNVKKACGPDSITPFLFKAAAEHISVPLSHLFNQSLSTGTLPFDWVSGNVVPIHKQNDKHVPGNYRPISLTSIVIKVFERILHRYLVSALESHHLLSSSQFGFRAKRSTTSLLVDAVDDWSLCLEQRGTVHCLLLDFAKAFDSVPHERLLLKLSSLGIHGNLLKWLRFFLTQRKQRVVINGAYSDWVDVTSGVPQGTVLGPLLFLLYVNDLDSVVKYSTIKLFADDVLLYAPVRSIKDCSALQDDLAAIFYWTTRWQLRLNPNKCEALAITNQRIPLTYTYHIDQHPISWRDSVKYLGLHVHSKLSWSKHCKSIVSKATRSLNCLRSSMFRCSHEAKYVAYRALVCPILEYAAVVWCPHATGDIKLLESLQGRAARWICGSRWSPNTSSWTVSTHDCCSQLCLPTLQSRRQYLSVCFLHDIYCKRAPLSFSKYCTFNPASSTRSHCLSLLPPISTINSRRYSFL